ncbi:uncharacterized protein LOC144450366 [Glandiceps talaboti]
MGDNREDANLRKFKGFFPKRLLPTTTTTKRQRKRRYSSESSPEPAHPTRSHGSSSASTSSGTYSSDNCTDRRMHRAGRSAWTERQPDRLHWYPASFPNLDPGKFCDERNKISDKLLILKICIERVMQWLLEPGKLTPPIINESEVSTVTVSEAVKNEIRKELEESYMCRIAEIVWESTQLVPLEILSNEKLSEIIMNIEGVHVPPKILLGIENIFISWLEINTTNKLLELSLDELMDNVVNHLYTNEYEMLQHRDYIIRLRGATIRQFETCKEQRSVQCDVEVQVNHYLSGMGKRFESKVLTTTENKRDHTQMDRSYPQMVYQFMAAAKDARFITDDYYVMYGISLCGTDGILLSRGHVWKQLIQRTKKCILEDPPFQKSHFLYQFVQLGQTIYPYTHFDIVPVLTLYLAYKAVLLLHNNTPC